MPTNHRQIDSYRRHFAAIGVTVPTKPAKPTRILDDGNIGRIADVQQLTDGRPSGPESPVIQLSACGVGHRIGTWRCPCRSDPAHEGCESPLSPGLVQVPFACAVDDDAMTETATRVPAHPADSVAAERLWDSLHQARTGQSRRLVADLEDAAFRRYLPLARTLAHTTTTTTTTTAVDDAKEVDRIAFEQVAELGLANAVLAWRQRTSAGLRRFARSSIIRELSSR